MLGGSEILGRSCVPHPTQMLEIQFQTDIQGGSGFSHDPFTENEVLPLNHALNFCRAFPSDAMVKQREVLIPCLSQEKPLVLVGVQGVVQPQAILILKGVKGKGLDFTQAIRHVSFCAVDVQA